jgi:nucleoside-diphosphate-sugar epimerase
VPERIALVTGATGFVGAFVCRALRAAGYRVRGVLRSQESAAGLEPGVEPLVLGDLAGEVDWQPALQGVDCAVHLAARAHILQERDSDPQAAYLRVNAAPTRRLALAAAQAGVRRLVYLSTARVNGADSGQRPFTESDPPAPGEPYERSKLEGERMLGGAGGNLEWVILRPPLVYGPGVKANFLALLRAVDAGFPLPLASLHNKRSLIYVDNLAGAVLRCVEHPAAAGRTFLVADGEDVSTPELVRRMADALGRTARLVPLPEAWLRLAGRLLGRQAAVERLCGSLQVDSGAIREALGWRPAHTLAQGLAATALWYRRSIA